MEREEQGRYLGQSAGEQGYESALHFSLEKSLSPASHWGEGILAVGDILPAEEICNSN